MEPQIKILFVDDNSEDVELLELELQRVNFNYQSKWVDTKGKYIAELKTFNPDIILCDYSMPSFNGMEAFKLMKEINLKIPFIVVTGAISEQLALNFLNEGVDDFVLKSNFQRVPKAITRSIEKKKAENSIKQSQANIQAIFDNSIEGFILTDENFLVKSFNKKAEELISNLTEKKVAYDENIFNYISKTEEDFLENKEIRVAGGFSIQYDDYYENNKDKKGWINYIINPVKIDGEVKGICITLRDITDLKQYEKKLKKANRMYAFISEINKMIVKVNDEQSLFKKVCEIAVQSGKFKMAWIGAINYENNSKNLIEQSGMNEGDIKLFKHLPNENSIGWKYISETGKHFVCNDIENDYELTNWKEIASSRGIRSFLVSPIQKSGTIIGTYNLYSSETNFFDEDEIDLLTEVAENISFTLDVFEKEKQRKEGENQMLKLNKQLQQLSSHLQSVREEERKHIAREIHDELGQQLTALKMDIGWIKHKQKYPEKEIDTKLQEMLNFSDSIIKTVRRISTELRPALIDDLGLVAALEWKCHHFEETNKIPCNFITTIQERKFNTDFSITVFRILQETLTNVSRHADAKEVNVMLSETETGLTVEISDDGKGFDINTIENTKTLGILGMKERANLMRGELQIKSEVNKGTQTRLIIPF